MHKIYDKCAPAVKFVKLDACGEDMIPLPYTVKPDGQAQIVPNQSVKASYATEWYTLEGGRVITCVPTMVVVGNGYTINICAVGDRYRWSIIGNIQRLSP